LTDIALPVKIGIFSAAVLAASPLTQKTPVLTLVGSGFDRQYCSFESEINK